MLTVFLKAPTDNADIVSVKETGLPLPYFYVLKFDY